MVREMNQRLAEVLITLTTLIISLCVHEMAHAWVALKKGDLTAKSKGRLTLNPLAHADLVGTMLIPAFCLYYGWPFIGWAKPVPVDPSNFKHPRRDLAWVSIAGPISNILLAVVGTAACYFYFVLDKSPTHPFVPYFAQFVYLNCLLACFNLLPVPPLDGFGVLQAFLPPSWAMRGVLLSRFGFLLLLVLLFTKAFYYIVSVPAQVIYGLLTSLLFVAMG
jgi:Zn-dependent protease